jgi:hypothetical protein
LHQKVGAAGQGSGLFAFGGHDCHGLINGLGSNIINSVQLPTSFRGALYHYIYRLSAIGRKVAALSVQSVAGISQGTVQYINNACQFFASDESACIAGSRLNVVADRYMV